jgi:hypothetical protein
MPKATISLKTNPKTRKPEIHIEYESEADALGHEHEQEHKKLAEQLLGLPIEDTSIVVSRGKPKQATTTEEKDREKQDELDRQKQTVQHRCRVPA